MIVFVGESRLKAACAGRASRHRRLWADMFSRADSRMFKFCLALLALLVERPAVHCSGLARFSRFCGLNEPEASKFEQHEKNAGRCAAAPRLEKSRRNKTLGVVGQWRKIKLLNRFEQLAQLSKLSHLN
jgi:hypothetical protein